MSAFYLAGRARLEVFRAVSDRGRPWGGLYLAGRRPLRISERALADGVLGSMAAIGGGGGEADLTWYAVNIVWLRNMDQAADRQVAGDE